MPSPENPATTPKLFMLLLGCKPHGRHTEQHDIFFGIASSLRELVPDIKSFWPEAGSIHIDAWREVNTVENCSVKVALAGANESTAEIPRKLFFINLGGYQENKFAEQHYIVLTVKSDKESAFKEARSTLFFAENNFDGNSHIDDKYGIDVDDIYRVEDILSPVQKEMYKIEISPSTDLQADQIHLGYFKLSNL
jgi:hypothetical protein